LMTQIENCSENGQHFFWLDGISDEYLEKVYQSATCLIACSEGEGFGLPLIEAAQYGLPVIARDIPVFREVMGEHASYFNSLSAKVLADEIEQWLLLFDAAKHVSSADLAWNTWQQSAEQLKQLMDNYVDQQLVRNTHD